MLEEIIDRYLEDHRFYHDLQHITNMFADHKRYKDTVNIKWNGINNKRINDAILYHDVIYNIGKQDVSNEQQSVDFYINNIGTESDDVVVDMILATEKHFTHHSYDNLISYFLDLDIMALAEQDENILFETQENIDKEFMTKLSEKEVYEGRLEFIQKSMKSYARFRIINTDSNNRILKNNIAKLENFYKRKLNDIR